MKSNTKGTTENQVDSVAPTKLPSPKLIFWIALLLPGAGHAYMGQAVRGLTFIFFIIMMFWIGIRLFPEFSFIGRHLGGIFVWGLSVIDAYKIAKVAHELTRYENTEMVEKPSGTTGEIK